MSQAARFSRASARNRDIGWEITRYQFDLAGHQYGDGSSTASHFTFPDIEYRFRASAALARHADA
jgi:hypothetical protein